MNIENAPFVLPIEISYCKRWYSENPEDKYSPTKAVLPSGIEPSHIQFAGEIAEQSIHEFKDGTTVVSIEISQPRTTLNVNILEDAGFFNKAVKLSSGEWITFRTSITPIDSKYERSRQIKSYAKNLNVISKQTGLDIQTKTIENTLNRIKSQYEYNTQRDIKVKENTSIENISNPNSKAAYLYENKTLEELIDHVTNIAEDIDGEKQCLA